MDWNRILSLLVAVGYVVGSILLGGLDGTIVLTLGLLSVCLACIWFGEEMGDYLGTGATGISISAPTPGVLIRIMGLGHRDDPLAEDGDQSPLRQV